MAKDAYWFKHDSNASRDIKMMKIKHIYDFWGTGLYWSVIELLREQNNYCFNSDESSLQLASSLVSCSDFNRFKSWYKDAVKFELLNDENGVFFSVSLCERMGKWETKKDNGSKGGRPKKTETETESKANHKPNRNHKIRLDKIIDKHIFNFNQEMLNYGFKQNLINDWLKVRKTKKATNTETAFKKFVNQIELTNLDKNFILEKCIEKSWSGFEADWIKNEIKSKPQMEAPDYQKFLNG